METRGGVGHHSNTPTYPGSHMHMRGCSGWEGEGMEQQASLALASSEQIICISVVDDDYITTARMQQNKFD